MASFDRPYATSHQSAIVNTAIIVYHACFFRYLTLKNILTIKSSLGITYHLSCKFMHHRWNIQTQCLSVIITVICLLLIVRVYLHSLIHKKTPEEAELNCVLLSFEVIQGHWNWYQSGKPVCRLLLKSHRSLVWSHRKGVSSGICGMKVGIKKTRGPWTCYDC